MCVFVCVLEGLHHPLWVVNTISKFSLKNRVINTLWPISRNQSHPPTWREAFNDAHSTFFHLWVLLYTAYCLNVSSWDDHIKKELLSVCRLCMLVYAISPYVFRLSVHLLSFYLTFCLFVVCWFVSSVCLLHRHKNVWFTVVLVSWSVYFCHTVCIFFSSVEILWKSWL